MAVSLLALRTGRALLQKYLFPLLILISKPKKVVLQEGLGTLKKCIYFIGSGTRDLPACSIVP
jgi:hypothetical protein